jgi:RimJ/RimL family protein N-acetyltransferase
MPWARSSGLEVHALVGAAYPHLDALRHIAAAGEGLHVHRDVRDVARLLSGMDACIGAAGSSTWERCCLGLPTITLVTAENQAMIARALVDEGIAADGGAIETDATGEIRIGGRLPARWVAETLAPFCTDAEGLAAFSARAARIVDGFGVTRVLRALFEHLPRGGGIDLEPLTADHAQITFEWQNYPGQRRHFRSPDAVQWDAHNAWLARAEKDDTRLLRIVRAGGVPAGVVRLEPSDLARRLWPDGEGREVSVIVAPELQGRGVATAALRALLDTAGRERVVAEVAPENHASARLFRSCGFAERESGIFVFEPSPPARDR